MNILHDPEDDRVKKIVVDYARSQLGMTEILSNDYDNIIVREWRDGFDSKKAVIYLRYSWIDTHELDESIKTIVNNAILDLLTK